MANLLIFGLVDSNIDPTANINGSKVQTTQHLVHSQASGTAILAATEFKYIVRAANATVLLFQAEITGVVPTGTDTVNVDLKKSTGGGAFATILSATIAFTSGSSLRALSVATLSSTSLVTNDVLSIVVTVSGSTGQGLVADCVVREQAQ